MEVQNLLEGMRLYTDEVKKQQESHPYEKNRRFRLAQLLTGCICQVLLQQVDKANSRIALSYSLCQRSVNE